MRTCSLKLLSKALLVLGAWLYSPCTHSANQPNILIILVDDLGYGDLSSYGAEDVRTPHIDSLMDAGMRFDRFYANCPVCSPTRAALLSGCYPDLVGVPGVIRTHKKDSWGYLDPDTTLLPEILREAGYHTGMIGKWHLGLESPNIPTERGFQFFQGFLGDMMDDYYTHRRHGYHYMRRNKEAIDPVGHATDLFSQWASDYVQERADFEDPFFLYLAYNAPHTPIQPPDAWFQRVKARESGITDQRAKLVALIEHMDSGIGQVLASLEQSGQRQDTLVVFTSDNGGQLGVGANCGFHRGGKQDMYEGGIIVPACVVWPGRIEAGARTDLLSMSMDLFPTLCELASVHPTRAIDGVSLLPALLGEKSPHQTRDMVWVRREGNMQYQGRDYYAFRRGDWKLLQNSPFAPYELYNLRSDPMEQHNMARKEKGIHRVMVRGLMDHLQNAGRISWQKRP
ncbi:MAG: sulfatase-like hydrolase/transferase [Verrucomicrobiota bacterium]|nr:sulfatase-like hydrolase/transferase [Verrucomicrobiota bacterium]